MQKERLRKLSRLVSLGASNRLISSMISGGLSGASPHQVIHFVPDIDGVVPIPDAPPYASEAQAISSRPSDDRVGAGLSFLGIELSGQQGAHPPLPQRNPG